MKNPRIYTLSSMIIGYFLIGNLNSYEQNALGNWFMTIGQILEANSAFEQAINNKSNDKPVFKNTLSNKDKQDIIDFLNNIENTLEQIKKEL